MAEYDCITYVLTYLLTYVGYTPTISQDAATGHCALPECYIFAALGGRISPL